MDLEIAIVEVKDGDAAGLLRAMDEGGSAHLLSAPGCRSAKVLRGIENPGTVVFLVEWDSLAAHTAATASEGFGKFVEFISPWMASDGAVAMQHFTLR